MLTTLSVANYRSLRELVVPLGELTVITGTNGAGKSNLYRALRLLADTARNGAVGALAREGGLPSTLWAGPPNGARSVRRGQPSLQSGPVTLRLGYAGDEFGYAVDLGVPGGDLDGSAETRTMFGLDPEIKSECVWAGPVLRPSAVLVERCNSRVLVRDSSDIADYAIAPFDSMLSEFADPATAPELLVLRDRMRGWRFYDHFRTDADAPARLSRVGTRTPVLAADGADLAAAIQTIREIGDPELLDEAIDDAFPGCQVFVDDRNGRFDLQWKQQGLLRPLGAAELSDGTLRYLLLVAALLTPRPPELLIFNEPETSLHPDLFAPLGHLIAAVSQDTQIIVVSHAQMVIDALIRYGHSVTAIELVKQSGETTISGQGLLDRPQWNWYER
ncbi:AAA family ATPase [Nocardia farcinica]|uniref:AAA family ATPase n=1 Tax=Nocardia farcinica TaxID=37329 RepID=UPI002454BCF4|nr:AAA family ATPase [Nocardia farcinica]